MAAGHLEFLVATMLAAVACAPPAAERLETLDQHAHRDELMPAYRERIAMTRPNLALARYLPVVTEHARWPLGLGVHPVLEPRFDVASALAEPGVTWIELCARGAQHRVSPAQHDQLEYLAAWCDVAAHEPDKALGRLANIVHAPVLGLRDAIEIDIADIVVDAGNAERAMHLLQRNHLVTVAELDLVAAMYFEIGDNDSARSFGRGAADADPNPRLDVRCHRLMRALELASESEHLILMKELHTLAGGKAPDPVCKAFDDELACTSAASVECSEYLHALGLKGPDLTAVEAYINWPVEAEDWGFWDRLATRLVYVNSEGVDEMLAIALEAAVQVSRCDRPHMKGIADYASIRLELPGHDRRVDDRLHVLAGAASASCDQALQR